MVMITNSCLSGHEQCIQWKKDRWRGSGVTDPFYPSFTGEKTTTEAATSRFTGVIKRKTADGLDNYCRDSTLALFEVHDQNNTRRQNTSAKAKTVKIHERGGVSLQVIPWPERAPSARRDRSRPGAAPARRGPQR
ncbi:hypothetical protein EVAR_54411_1 [Eumeta japonica]|uniref:Uncharacterized protein n=1 Tax=Eumeta variegata TaxID=151549 RepID=A0A4C1Y8Z0_EUMVA|nr:hypothetical protein EVAR_54411_1 [Eumeta japonica]